MSDEELGSAITLLRMPLEARRDLLQVLTSDSDVRADVIRQLHELGKDGLADVLIELDADVEQRGRAIAALRRVT